jgi:hypothetical protein
MVTPRPVARSLSVSGLLTDARFRQHQNPATPRTATGCALPLALSEELRRTVSKNTELKARQSQVVKRT